LDAYWGKKYTAADVRVMIRCPLVGRRPMAVHREVRAPPSHHALQLQKQEPEERVAERLK
jgi:hypothetical protein